MSGTSRIAGILQEKGIILPTPSTPTASYVPYVITGSLVFISGQGPRHDGKLQYTGKVGKDVTLEEGQQAARICMLNVLSHLNAACGNDLDKVKRAVRIAGLVNCASDFTQHPQVINGASDLLLEIFGERGKHARIATGANSLPANMSVEVEAIFEIET
ncbi:RidA family protein [Desulfovibrio sp. OttesenSCG-928-O18]|nr:RidA family protein [Desulfovibrio sp. OttesenSCG-928-O18]